MPWQNKKTQNVDAFHLSYKIEIASIHLSIHHTCTTHTSVLIYDIPEIKGVDVILFCLHSFSTESQLMVSHSRFILKTKGHICGFWIAKICNIFRLNCQSPVQGLYSYINCTIQSAWKYITPCDFGE